MSRFISYTAIIVFSLFMSVGIYAQVGEPINLPEFVVTGKERIDIPAGAKQAPSKPATLTAKLLDSLNPVEKQPIPTLPPKSIARPKRSFELTPGYLDVEVGNYITPRLLAGYTLKASGYRLDFSGDLEASDGWAPNTSYMNLGVDVLSTFVAPDKFIFFGGSTTEADLNLRMKSYKLFADPSTPDRSSAKGGAGIAVEGLYEGLVYRAGASYTMTSVSTTGRLDGSDGALRGFLFAEQRWSGFDAGAMVDMRLSSYNGQSYPFIEGTVRGRFHGDVARLQVGGGVQTAESTEGVVRFGLLVYGVADIYMGEKLTLQAEGRTGLRPTRFESLLQRNPYISTAAVIDHAYDVFDVRGSLVFHPTLSFMGSAGIRIRRTDRDILWLSDSVSTFLPTYATVNTLQVPVDFRWTISAVDALIGDITYTATDVSGAKQQTYVPAITASVGHDRQWSRELYSTVTLLYVGDRWADALNTVQLSGYIDVRASVEYSVSQAITINLRAQNLFGSKMVLWNGYLERGMFIAGGLSWKF